MVSRHISVDVVTIKRWSSRNFLRKNTFSRQQQESVLRVKRGKTTAESPSGRSPQTRRDLKKSRTYEEAPANEPHAQQMHMDKPSKTRPRPILPAPSSERDGKKRKLAKRVKSSAEPSTLPKQEEILSESGLICWTYWYFIFAKFNTCIPLHIKVD